jgi:hypothetical protein
VTEHFEDFEGFRRGVEPVKKGVGGISGIVDEHIDGTPVVDLLSGVAKVNTMAETVHGLEERGSSSGAGGRTTTRASLTRADDRGSRRVLIGGVMRGFIPMDDDIERLLPHCKGSGRCTHNREAKQGEGHNHSVKTGGGITLELAERRLGEEGEEIMKDFGECSVLAFTAGFAVLASVEKVL